MSFTEFAEFIAESFESTVDLIWDIRSLSRVIARFTIRQIAIDVDFEQREQDGAWHVAFNTVSGELTAETLTLAFPIFNGVFQAVREFIAVREPEMMVFVAKEEHLAHIYETYLRREQSSIEALGYRLEGPQRIEPYTEFTLERVKPSDWRELNGGK
jgi:hypothetical protein